MLVPEPCMLWEQRPDCFCTPELIIPYHAATSATCPFQTGPTRCSDVRRPEGPRARYAPVRTTAAGLPPRHRSCQKPESARSPRPLEAERGSRQQGTLSAEEGVVAVAPLSLARFQGQGHRLATRQAGQSRRYGGMAEPTHDSPVNLGEAFIAHARALKDLDLKKGHPLYTFAFKEKETLPGGQSASKGVGAFGSFACKDWPDWVKPVPNAAMQHNGAAFKHVDKTMNARGSTFRSQQYRAQIAYWNPHQMFDGCEIENIRCLHCDKPGVVRTDGWSTYLRPVAGLGGDRLFLFSARAKYQECPKAKIGENGKPGKVISRAAASVAVECIGRLLSSYMLDRDVGFLL